MAQEKAKKPNIFKRMGKWFKDFFAELKKVTWPKFPLVLKKLGVVLVVVVIFLVFITLADLGIGQLYQLLVGGGFGINPIT